MTRFLPARIVLYLISALVLGYLILPVVIIVPISFSSARFLTFQLPSLSLRCISNISRIRPGCSRPFDLDGRASDRRDRDLARGRGRLRYQPVEVAHHAPDPHNAAVAAGGANHRHRGRHLPRLCQGRLVATMPGLVLANVMLGLPYVVISVLAGVQSFDPAQETVARSLGMNRLRSFFFVTLPQIKSSVVAGGIFAYISAMDETIVALFSSGGQYQPLTKRT
jgi:putative spermidine/putrescine transport system permease protein